MIYRAGLTWNAFINSDYRFGVITFSKNTEKEITFLRGPEPCPSGHLWSLSATWRFSISPSSENPSLTQFLTPAAWCWWNQCCWRWTGMRGSLDVVGMWAEPGTRSFRRLPFYLHDENDEMCSLPSYWPCSDSHPDILCHLHFCWGFHRSWFGEREKKAVFHSLLSYQ